MTVKKKKKGGGIFWKLLFLVALCVFCFSMYQLVNIYLGYKKGVDEYHAVVLPEDKAAFVEKEKAEGRKRCRAVNRWKWWKRRKTRKEI